jgi:hypothetical protein
MVANIVVQGQLQFMSTEYLIILDFFFLFWCKCDQFCYYFWKKKPKFQYYKIDQKKKKKKKKKPGPGVKLNFTISNIRLV